MRRLESTLCAQVEALRARIRKGMPLSAVVDAFEEVCRTPLEDDMCLFEVNAFGQMADWRQNFGQEQCADDWFSILKQMSLESGTPESAAEMRPANGPELLAMMGIDPHAVLISLVRQCPDEADEFFQIHVDLTYRDDGDSGNLAECLWEDENGGRAAWFEQVRDSRAFRWAASRKPEKIDIRLDQT